MPRTAMRMARSLRSGRSSLDMSVQTSSNYLAQFCELAGVDGGTDFEIGPYFGKAMFRSYCRLMVWAERAIS